MLKVNHARVQTMCLRAEKTKLSKENVQLKHYIKRYLTDLALKSNRPKSMSQEVQKIDAYGKLLYVLVFAHYYTTITSRVYLSIDYFLLTQTVHNQEKQI